MPKKQNKCLDCGKPTPDDYCEDCKASDDDWDVPYDYGYDEEDMGWD